MTSEIAHATLSPGQVSLLLCDCGDLIGSPGVEAPPEATHRPDGKLRGVCACFRRRARTRR